MSKAETLNQAVPPEAIAKWSIREAKREHERAESVAVCACGKWANG